MLSKEELCSFYTESEAIQFLMASLLQAGPEDSVLEPCAGEGALVKAVMAYSQPKSFTLIELDSAACENLKEKFSFPLFEADTLLGELPPTIENSFDKVIGNPPFGAFQSRERRAALKKRFPGHYVKETYSLFLLRSLELLKEGGRLVFIIPDTFLYLVRHSHLREKLLEGTTIEKIILFPSRFFKSVKFAYSGLCIISLRKGRIQDSQIEVHFNLGSDAELFKIARHEEGDRSTRQWKQSELSARTMCFLTTSPSLLEKGVPLGEICSIVTGLYTGDNTRFVTKAGKPEEGTIPFFKGAKAGRYDYGEHRYFVRWDKEALNYYKTNKKARFQNASFYFHEGIGVPMVKSTRLKAFFMEGFVFDQSVVGIFPKNPFLLDYLLAFLNSSVADTLIRSINPTANNSANYLKRLPVIFPDEAEIETISEWCRMLRNKEISVSQRKAVETDLEERFKKLYGF